MQSLSDGFQAKAIGPAHNKRSALDHAIKEVEPVETGPLATWMTAARRVERRVEHALLGRRPVKDANVVVASADDALALFDAGKKGVEHATFGGDVEGVDDEAAKAPCPVVDCWIEPSDAGHEDQGLPAAPRQCRAVVVEVVDGLEVDVELDRRPSLPGGIKVGTAAERPASRARAAEGDHGVEPLGSGRGRHAQAFGRQVVVVDVVEARSQPALSVWNAASERAIPQRDADLPEARQLSLRLGDGVLGAAPRCVVGVLQVGPQLRHRRNLLGSPVRTFGIHATGPGECRHHGVTEAALLPAPALEGRAQPLPTRALRHPSLGDAATEHKGARGLQPLKESQRPVLKPQPCVAAEQSASIKLESSKSNIQNAIMKYTVERRRRKRSDFCRGEGAVVVAPPGDLSADGARKEALQNVAANQERRRRPNPEPGIMERSTVYYLFPIDQCIFRILIAASCRACQVEHRAALLEQPHHTLMECLCTLGDKGAEVESAPGAVAGKAGVCTPPREPRQQRVIRKPGRSV